MVSSHDERVIQAFSLLISPPESAYAFRYAQASVFVTRACRVVASGDIYVRVVAAS